jgi:hypothetical protein
MYLFLIAIIVYTIGALSFLFFAECEIQEWAKNYNNIKGEEKTKVDADSDGDDDSELKQQQPELAPLKTT